jgi:soluble lytic murein transglycosylase-like protein
MPRRIGVVAALVAVVFVLPVNAGAQLATPVHHRAQPHQRTVCQTSSCVERVAAKRCSQSRVQPCIERAARRWRVSFPMLKRKAWCESRNNPYVVNPASGTTGLFQFMRSTWASTPYSQRSITSAKWNALAAAWMHRVGRGGEWQCQ